MSGRYHPAVPTKGGYDLRRIFSIVVALALVSALAVAALATAKPKPPKHKKTPPAQVAGVLSELPVGYTVHLLSNSCDDTAISTETGAPVQMPDDFDNNQLVRGPKGRLWLVNNHELTKPVAGDFQGDASKCAVPEQQTADDGDSNGWGSVSRLTLGKDGLTVTNRELIATGLHDLCAGTLTPWKTFLTNEEFPFVSDPDKRSGWVWEVNPRTGEQKRATGMGRFSHEQEARVGKAWIETDDRGNAQYLYRFVPDRARDLSHGKLYALSFDRTTKTGHWVLLNDVSGFNPADAEAAAATKLGAPTAANTFVKAEGMIPAHGGNAVIFSESGSGADPGRVWLLKSVNKETVKGTVLVEGNFSEVSRPDNLLLNKAGDLFILEDNGSALANPATGGVNDIWVLTRKHGLVLFGHVVGGGEGTGPILSHDQRTLYLSIQDQELTGYEGESRVIAVRANFKHFGH